MNDKINPQVAVVMVVLTYDRGVLKTALYVRTTEPFTDQLSLPAGLILPNESLDEAAERVLKEKTGIDNVYLEQLHTFGDLERDPVNRTVGVAYFAFVPIDKASLTEEGSQWVETANVPQLAFDHSKILKYALLEIKKRILYSNVIHSLLPDKFSLTQLQEIYEAILGNKIDKRNFRKKILSSDLIRPTKSTAKGLRQRPAKLYSFSFNPLEKPIF